MQGESQAIAIDNERELIQSADDRVAFAELVNRYRRMVCGYLVRCGVNDVDDLFQDIFIKIHQARHTYKGTGSVRSWVMAITANEVRMYFRSRKRETPSLVVAGESTPSTVQERAEGLETAQWLEEQLARLSPTQRQVVTLHCIQQVPQKEIARMLDIPVNTVKTNLHRARSVLTQAMSRRLARLRQETE